MHYCVCMSTYASLSSKTINIFYSVLKYISDNVLEVGIIFLIKYIFHQSESSAGLRALENRVTTVACKIKKNYPLSGLFKSVV